MHVKHVGQDRVGLEPERALGDEPPFACWLADIPRCRKKYPQFKRLPFGNGVCAGRHRMYLLAHGPMVLAHREAYHMQTPGVA